MARARTATDRVLVAVPAFGLPELTDLVVADLVASARGACDADIVVVDNRGDYETALRDDRLSVHRSGRNLRWIGTVNWALGRAMAADDAVCVVLNNDTRLGPAFLDNLVRTFRECDDVALAAACYDDFWLHQRAHTVPAAAREYEPLHAYRSVPFCDGTGLAFSVAAARRLGVLDTVAFPRHGYGADIDYALRARSAGLRCVVTDGAYLSHRRRATMNAVGGETSERNRAEILTGMGAVWGPGWRRLAGLGDGAFPAHNTGSAADWYL